MPVAVGTLHSVLVGARTGHMDDICIARMVALFPMSPFFACCGHMAKLFLSSVIAGVFVLRRAIASRVSMSETHPHLMVATVIFFLKTQRAVGVGERTV